MTEEDKLKELGIHTPQESVAKAIDRLSSVDRIKLLSVLKKKSDVAKFTLMYSIGEQFNYKWLQDIADYQLQLNVSLDKGRGRKDMVKVIQNSQGFKEGLREKITSFLRSGT